MVFGRNTNLPNLVDNKLPAQEKSTLADIVLHISALHAALHLLPLNQITKLALGKDIKISEITHNISDEVFLKGAIFRPGKDLPQFWVKMTLLCLSDKDHTTSKPIHTMYKHYIGISLLKQKQ